MNTLTKVAIREIKYWARKWQFLGEINQYYFSINYSTVVIVFICLRQCNTPGMRQPLANNCYGATHQANQPHGGPLQKTYSIPHDNYMP